MKLIDLSSPVDARYWEPDPVEHRSISPREGAEHCCAEMRAHFGLVISPDEFPEGEFLNNDFLTLSAHTGTHVDAPAHYGSRGPFGTPRTIDELPLDWFVGPGVLLDLRGAQVGAVDAAYLRERLDNIGYSLTAGDIVLLHTGTDRWVGTPKYFTDFVGLDSSAVELLLDHGVRVIGTDAFSLDAPFTYIIDQYQRTGDRSVLWPAHVTGRDREYCQIERLANLDSLPAPYGFEISCFPIKITKAGAGWARVVASVVD
jgi:cyclase